MVEHRTITLAQKIHAHNDYEKPRPFVNAYEQRADYIEADVWLQNGQLVVSHNKPKANAPTLDSLYIKPIVPCSSRTRINPAPTGTTRLAW